MNTTSAGPPPPNPARLVSPVMIGMSIVPIIVDVEKGNK